MSDPVSKMPHFEGYSISHNENGTVTFTCSPDKAGMYRISVEYNHSNLTGFPLCFVVKEDQYGYKTAYKSSTEPFDDEFALYCGLSSGGQLEGITLVNPGKACGSLPVQSTLNPGKEGQGPEANIFGVDTVNAVSPGDDVSTLHDDEDDDHESGWLQTADNLRYTRQGQEVYDSLVLGVSEPGQTDGSTPAHIKQEVTTATLLEGSTNSVDTNTNTASHRCESTLLDTKDTLDQKPFTNLTVGAKRRVATNGWIYRCDVVKCNKIFKFEESLRMHRKMYHKNIFENRDIRDPSTNTTEPQQEVDKDTRSSDATVKKSTRKKSVRSGMRGEGHQCEVCDKVFSTRYHLQRHSVVHHAERPFICATPGCGRKFKLKQSLEKHLKFHSHVKKTSCGLSSEFVCDKPHCGKRFRLKQGLAFHMKMHLTRYVGEKTSRHCCEVCQKVFPTSYKLRRHSIVHTVDELYVCDVKTCGKTFGQRAVLKRHMQMHTTEADPNGGIDAKEKPFVCDQPLCERQFDLQEALTDHLEWHESYRKELGSSGFQCGTCQREFFNAYELQRHSSVHSTQKKFVCEKPGCGHTYKSKQSLVRHTLLHSKSNAINQKLKPFVCEELACGRRFKLEDSLIYHSKMHSISEREKPKALICEVCNKKYPTAYKLQRHKRVHSLQRQFICDQPGCGKSFKLKDSLNFHIHMHSKSERCTICSKFVPSLKEHMLNHYPLVGSCVRCRQVFIDTDVMNQHECSADKPPRNIEGAEQPEQANDGKSSFVADATMEDRDAEYHDIPGTSHDLLETQDETTNDEANIVTPTGLNELDPEESNFCVACNVHFDDREAVEAHECPSQVKNEMENTQITDSEQDLVELCEEAIGCVCPVCGKEFKDNYKLQRHLVVHTGKKLFTCTVEGCSKQYKNSETLKNHQSSAHGQGKFKCTLCDQTFHISSRLQRHVRSHDTSKWLTCPVSDCSRKYRGKDALKKHADAEHSYGEYKCSVCPRTFQLKSHLQSHIQSHVPQSTWKCLDCNKTFKYEATLSYHNCLGPAGNTASKKKKKSNNAPLFCPVCDKEFTKPSKLVLHVATHSDTKPFMCELCGKSLKTRDTLKKHIDEMHNEGSTIQGENGEKIFVAESKSRPYLCTYCGKTFRRREHYRQHVLVHESRAQIPCTHEGCTKSFPTHYKLRQHVRSVHAQNEGVHQCEFCQKSFKRLSILKAHVRTHQSNAFVCTEPDCFAKFSTKNSMQRHVLLKHREMPAVFQCTVSGCNAKFKVKNDLRQHTLSHATERNFQCTDCGKAFKTKNTLRMHTAIHSEERQSMCSYCGRYFTRKHRLRAHMAKHVDQTQRLDQHYGQWT